MRKDNRQWDDDLPEELPKPKIVEIKIPKRYVYQAGGLGLIGLSVFLGYLAFQEFKAAQKDIKEYAEKHYAAQEQIQSPLEIVSPFVDVYEQRGKEDLDAIILGITSPNLFSRWEERESSFNPRSIEKAVLAISKAYGIDQLILSGITEEEVDAYNQGKRLDLTRGAKGEAKRLFEFYERIINGRKWRLYPAETDETKAERIRLAAPLRAVKEDLENQIKQANIDIYNQYVVILGDESNPESLRFEEESIKRARAELNSEIKRLIISASERLNSLMTKERMEGLYELLFVDKLRKYAEHIKHSKEQGKGPLLIVDSENALPTLFHDLKDFSYVSLIIEGRSRSIAPLSPEILKSYFCLMPEKVPSVNINIEYNLGTRRFELKE